MKTEETTKLWN